MSETYMITAKTVEEAIAIANREYADETHEVSYEIIDMPKKGFLGIGAKDAKIKVTVSKSVSSELDSLVADLRGMKVLTSKGDSGEHAPKTEKSEKKPAQPKKPAEKSDKTTDSKPQPKSVQQNQQKQNKPAADKLADKPADKPLDKAQPKPAQKNGENKAQPKSQQPAEKKPQNQPKTDVKTEEAKPQQRPAQAKKQDKVQNQPKSEPKAEVQEVKPVKAPAPVEEPAPVKAPAPVEVPAAPETPVAPAEVRAEAAEKRETRSSLNNQGKPQKRHQQKHSAPEQNIASSSFAVSAPMGLTDFVAEENEGSFGSANADTGRSAGRMNNDIRRSKKNQPKADKGENKPATKPAKADAKNERVIFEDRKSMITRYDVAESDEDYEKLDNLEDRELTIDEIRASVKSGAPAADISAADGSDALDAAIEAAVAPLQPAQPAEKTRREAVSEAEMNFALDFANTLLANMGLEAKAEAAQCPEDEEFDVTEECTVYPKINIVGDDTGILIGHHGETLDAIQYLVNLSALRQSKQKDGDYVKIVVDIENYREKREDTLRALARRMAARAVKYKRNVFLEPMNAYERRIIHSELQNVENVSTHSVGTDRDRKIIITYEGEDKAPDNRSRRRRGGHGKGHGANAAEAVHAASAENASAENDSAEKAQNSGAKGERRRPKKVQKMPIEKIGDILPDGEHAESANAEE